MNIKLLINSFTGWLFGILFIIIGIGLAFADSKFFSGLIMFVVATILLPPTAKLIEAKFKLKISPLIKIIIGVIGFIVFVVSISSESNSAKNELTPQKQVSETTKVEENINSQPQTDEEEDEKIKTEKNMQEELPKLSTEQELRIAANHHHVALLGLKSIVEYEIVELVIGEKNKAWIIYHSKIKNEWDEEGKWYYYFESEWIRENGKWVMGDGSNKLTFHGSKPEENEFKIHNTFADLADQYTEELFDKYSLLSTIGGQLDKAEDKAFKETALKYNVSTEDVTKYFMHVEMWSMYSNEGQQWLKTVGSQYSDSYNGIKDITTSNISIKNEYGIVSVLGEIKNNTNKTAKIIYITITFYDKNDRIINTAVDTQGNLSPGQTKTFDARGIYSSAFSRYKIDIDALY